MNYAGLASRFGVSSSNSICQGEHSLSLDNLLEIHACYLNYITFFLMLSAVLGGFDLLFAQTVVDWFIGKSLWSEVCTPVPEIAWSIPA